MKNQSSGIEEAYYDRNQAAMLAAKLATLWGIAVGWGEDPEEPGWPVLFIELPTGQVSWHIPEAEARHLQLSYQRHWDGHTVEKKRERIDDFISTVEGYEHKGIEEGSMKYSDWLDSAKRR